MGPSAMGLIASMTGYGRAEARGVRMAVLAEARSLNHRFLEIAVRSGRGLGAVEPEVRQLVQARLARGRVDVTLLARRLSSEGVGRLDHALAIDYARSARALARAVGLAPDLTLGDLLRLPGVVSLEEAEGADGECAALVKEAVQQALDELCRMRQAEGTALAAALSAHLERLEGWAADLEALLPRALARIQERVRTRVAALLGDLPVDPGRVAQEAALWAAKGDVAEELARLRAHAAQFRRLLAAGGPVGRQLDFLAQELHREVNTIAAKADDAELIGRILEGRTVVERLREQVQNVE